MKIVVVYEPSDKELRKIQESWIEDYEKNKAALSDWFYNRLAKKIIDNEYT